MPNFNLKKYLNNYKEMALKLKKDAKNIQNNISISH